MSAILLLMYIHYPRYLINNLRLSINPPLNKTTTIILQNLYALPYIHYPRYLINNLRLSINPPLYKTTTIILENLHALRHSNYCPTGHSSRSLKAPLATNSCGFSTTSTNLICESATAAIKSISREPLAFASEQNGVSKHYVSGNSNYFFLFSILLVLPTR